MHGQPDRRTPRFIYKDLFWLQVQVGQERGGGEGEESGGAEAGEGVQPQQVTSEQHQQPGGECERCLPT